MNPYNSRGSSVESTGHNTARSAMPSFRSPSRRFNLQMEPQSTLTQQEQKDISIRLFRKVQSPQPKMSREWKSLRISSDAEKHRSQKVSPQSRTRLFSRLMHSPQQALSPERWTTRKITLMDHKVQTLTIFNTTKDNTPLQTQIRQERNKIPLASLLKYRYNRKYIKPMPTQEEKAKFGEFFSEKLKSIKRLDDEADDDYKILEKNLEIQEVKYLQATKFREIHPVLKKLLQQQRLKETTEQSEKKYYSKKQREEQIIEQEKKEQAVDQLIVEYRRKAGFEEILGDAIKDRAQIQGFIDKVISIQNEILKQFKHKLRHIKTNPMKRFNKKITSRRKNIQSEGYDYIALKFFIKVGHDLPCSNFTKLKIRLARIKQLGLNLKDVMRETIFTVAPFERKGSRQFFDILKLEDEAQVKNQLHQCPWFVYDFDVTNQTALHIVAKRGNLKLTELLIENHSDPNALDFLGQTPLFYAMKNNNQQIAMLLLAHGASPWSDQKNHYSRLKMYEDDVQIRQQFKKARQIELMVAMSPSQVQKKLKMELMKQLSD